MIEEEFRSVKGYEGLYEVSNLGRVKSLCNSKEHVLVGCKNTKGYLHVILCKDGKKKLLLVHRLVAEAFIPNPDGLPCVNHKDETRDNNVVTNLEWCTAKYNANYGTAVKRRAEKRSKCVYQYTKSGSFVRSYPSTNEAERRTGYSQGYISNCCNGKYKQAYGYRWSYDPPTSTTNRVLF